jgi:hypothetical protein
MNWWVFMLCVANESPSVRRSVSVMFGQLVAFLSATHSTNCPLNQSTNPIFSINYFWGGLWINGYFCYALRTNTTYADHDKANRITNWSLFAQSRITHSIRLLQSNYFNQIIFGGLWINEYFCYVLRTNTTYADHDKATYIWPIDRLFSHPIAYHFLIQSPHPITNPI